MIFFLSLILFPTHTFAFPEMIRHGYTNCITCHLSSNGGGTLTEYGRAISKDVMSRGAFFWETKMDLKTPLENKDEQPLAGSFSLPKGLYLGGDFRALQLIEDNPRQTRGEFVFMQADLEGAYSDGKRLAVDEIGRAHV